MARPAGLDHRFAEQREARGDLETGAASQLAKRVGAPGRTRTCGPRLRSSVISRPSIQLSYRRWSSNRLRAPHLYNVRSSGPANSILR